MLKEHDFKWIIILTPDDVKIGYKMATTLKNAWDAPILPEAGSIFEKNWWTQFLIFASVSVVLTFAAINLERVLSTTRHLCNDLWGTLFLTTGEIFLTLTVGVFVWQVILVWKYRPAPSCSDKQLPRCTVIVPAYNEGRHVLMALESLAKSDYPADKLQIIAIDDGSADDTWHWIKMAAKKLKGRITPLKHAVNKGKRHALYSGFVSSTGDVIVTVDSDSVVEPKTLRRLVSPFVHDKKVGAVAGNVRVLNRKDGIIPRMMDVTFFYSFDFVRASQSMVNTVMCTPGALSAYRADLVKNVMDEWVNQTFLGKPYKIGEDRAITNLILREGYYVRFQQNAMVYTNIPSDYKSLCRMLLRWGRSNVRENMVMTGFAFRKFREGSALGAQINLIMSWLEMTVAQVLLAVSMGYLIQHPFTMGLNILIGIVISSGVSAAFYYHRYRNTDALLAYAYAIFSFVALNWITPYSVLTVHNSGWLTRQISVQKVQTVESTPSQVLALSSVKG